MASTIEPISPKHADAVLAWARLCGALIANQWQTTVHVQTTTEAAFTPAGRMRLVTGDRDVAAVLADERLLRALSHAVHESMSLPPGAGLLTDVEQGLVDFLSIKLLHTLGPHLPATPPAVAAIDFDGVSVNASAAALSFTVAVGGISGGLRVEFPTPPAASLAPPAFAVDADGATNARAFVTLAAVPLSHDEWRHLEPGDAVALACSALLHRPVELQTDSGWRLATGRVVVDSATLLTIELADTRSTQITPADDTATVRLATPVAALLADPWPVGHRVDIARTAADVLLCRSDDCWHSELVRIDGELAVRLLDKTEGGRP